MLGVGTKNILEDRKLFRPKIFVAGGPEAWTPGNMFEFSYLKSHFLRYKPRIYRSCLLAPKLRLCMIHLIGT